MLVRFHKGFTMEGESTVKVYKHWWSRGKEERMKIYLHTGVRGYCDESEVESEVERLTAEELKSRGWGKDFTGWQRVLTSEELVEVGKTKGWDPDEYNRSDNITIKTLDNWTVEKAAKELNGKQFAQYCRDYGIVLNVENK